jgi:hypothetical protein
MFGLYKKTHVQSSSHAVLSVGEITQMIFRWSYNLSYTTGIQESAVPLPFPVDVSFAKFHLKLQLYAAKLRFISCTSHSHCERGE